MFWWHYHVDNFLSRNTLFVVFTPKMAIFPTLIYLCVINTLHWHIISGLEFSIQQSKTNRLLGFITKPFSWHIPPTRINKFHNFYSHQIIYITLFIYSFYFLADLSKKRIFTNVFVFVSTTIIYFATVKHFIIMKPNRSLCDTKRSFFGGSRKRSENISAIIFIIWKAC